MMKNDNGGHAFPRAYAEDTTGDWKVGVPSQDGMSQRMWLAGQALLGIIVVSKRCDTNEEISKVAFAIADAMITEETKEYEG